MGASQNEGTLQNPCKPALEVNTKRSIGGWFAIVSAPEFEQTWDHYPYRPQVQVRLADVAIVGQLVTPKP